MAETFANRIEAERHRLQTELRKTAADPNATAEDCQKLVDEATALQKAEEAEPVGRSPIDSRAHATRDDLARDALEHEHHLCASCAKAKGTELDGEGRLVCRRCKRGRRR